MYQVIKSLHIIFIVTWFAGLFYIFRLFVYHRMNIDKLEMVEIFSLMEKRLLYYICVPSSICVPLFGTIMIMINTSLINQNWIFFKLIFVLPLYIYQHFSIITYKRFKKKSYFLSEKQCRYINEIPSILLILIIFIAYFKNSII